MLSPWQARQSSFSKASADGKMAGTAIKKRRKSNNSEKKIEAEGLIILKKYLQILISLPPPLFLKCFS
jgi:hypothetical protein